MMEPAAFALDRTRHAAVQIFEHLRAQIISLALPPGTALSRALLAEHYGVSQTPVRDALMRLAEESLVHIYPQHTTEVSRIDIAAARQMHFLRRSLELEIAHVLVQSPQPLLLQRLHRCIAQQRASHDSGDDQAFMDADQAFHRNTYEAVGMHSLWILGQRHSGHLDRLRRLHLPEAGKAERIMDDHQRLCNAIAAQDATSARQVLRAHLAGTLSQVDDICRRWPGYVLPEGACRS